MLVEKHFYDRSAYPKVSDTATPIEAVEWFAKNKGIINLDDLNTKVHSVIEDENTQKLAQAKAKKLREAKAQDDFLDAMFNLDTGTAPLRQTNDRTPIKTVKAIKAKKKVVARKKTVKDTTESGHVDRTKAYARRMEMMLTLDKGEKLPYREQSKDPCGRTQYYRQYMDIRWLVSQGLDIVRIKCLQDERVYLVKDTYTKYQSPRLLNARLSGSDRNKVADILKTGEMLCVCDLSEETTAKIASRLMVILADKNDMNIHCVYRERKLEGWIVLKTEAEIKQVKEFQDDIDVVKALESTDYLKIRQAVAARMPDANINEIRDVALSEYKQYNMINRSDSFTVTPRRPHKAPVSTSQPPRNCNTAPNYGLRSAIANEILETLIREGVYHVKSFLKSKNYLSSIICDIRSMGYELECIKENREAISYKLIQK